MRKYLVSITDSHAGQRLDNYLLGQLKGVPKSRIYRSIRQGEVRVNKHRTKPDYRLVVGDEVRIPPLRISEAITPGKPPIWQQQVLAQSIIYENDDLLIINKPAGMAAHGGSGINFGVIETLRFLRPKAKFLELVHRLDRDTSGCLMLAKKRSVLTNLHQMLQEQKVEKTYLALLKGHWQDGNRKVSLPLLKSQLISGERMVKVNKDGKMSTSLFQPLQHFANATLVKVVLKTGRTHQIRVHAAHIGYPIACDEKYGDKNFNQQLQKTGLKRMFLHAAALKFLLPSMCIDVCACMDKDLVEGLKKINKTNTTKRFN